MLLIHNLLHRQQLDDSAGSLMERGAFLFSVFGVPKADEETALPAAFPFALHDSFESINVRPANLVHLLHLNREPVLRQQAAFGRLGADGEDAAIDAHVANLHFVRSTAVPHMNFRRLNVATSEAFNSNHSPFLRFASNRFCQYASMPAGSSVLITWTG